MSILTDTRSPPVRAAIVVTALFLFAACSEGEHVAADDTHPHLRIGGKDKLIPDDPTGDLPSSPSHISQTEEQAKIDRATRFRHQREAALRFGSQSGFASRAREILEAIESRSGELSTVFDFSRVTKPAPGRAGVFIPPVVRRADEAFQSTSDGRTISAADTYYAILKPERLAPMQPTWRDWLLFSPDAPKPLPASLSPVDAVERKRVKAWVGEGWAAGVRQAEREMSDRLKRLQRDFGGMLEFRRLAALGMIEQAKFASAEFGVSGEPGEMRLGNRTVSLEGELDFRRDPTGWRRQVGHDGKTRPASVEPDPIPDHDGACQMQNSQDSCRLPSP